MDIEDEYSEVIIERGKEYLSSVIYCIKINNKLYGKVQGSRIYETEWSAPLFPDTKLRPI